MTVFLLLVALSLVSLGALYALARVIDGDGYAHRPAPRSHDGWGVVLPSVPPAAVNR